MAEMHTFKEIVVARTNRHHIPGQIWHLTHRAVKENFYLNLPINSMYQLYGLVRPQQFMFPLLWNCADPTLQLMKR